MQVAAIRDFEILNGEETKKAQLRIYVPTQVKDVEWRCVYELKGFQNEKRKEVPGADGYQALYLAMKTACTEIAISQEYKSEKLTLFDEKSFNVEQMMGFAPA
jgi:hypothetical protein